jgi:hypothetical protein
MFADLSGFISPLRFWGRVQGLGMAVLDPANEKVSHPGKFKNPSQC